MYPMRTANNSVAASITYWGVPAVGTVLLVELLFAHTGLVNKGLYTLGLPVADWFHARAAFRVVIALYLWKNTDYSVILLLSGLITLPASLLPRENILELSYYREEFAVLTSGLSGFPELLEELSAAGAAARGLLYFGLSAGLFPLLLLAENLPVRRNA